jgi:hypothetical protein
LDARKEIALEVAEQLSVFLVNRPGVLAKVCSALSDAGVDLRAISVSDTVDHAVVRLVTTDSELARTVLERGGALVVETDVLMITLANKPGALADMANKLSEAKLNIEYSYGSIGAADKVTLVMRINDVEKAMKVLA